MVNREGGISRGRPAGRSLQRALIQYYLNLHFHSPSAVPGCVGSLCAGASARDATTAGVNMDMSIIEALEEAERELHETRQGTPTGPSSHGIKNPRAATQAATQVLRSFAFSVCV